MTPNREAINLRTLAGLTVRRMSALAGLVDGTGWSKIERGELGIDPVRWTLTRARVALLSGDEAGALAVIREDMQLINDMPRC